MEFPADFTMKVFGNTEINLEAIVVAAIRAHKVDVERLHIAARLSSAGKYTSLTATFHVESQEQLDSIYRELSSNPEIIMVL